MEYNFARMPFNCFKYQGFTSASKRYHTAAAKHSAAFFDSSFNHIRQNTKLQTLEKVAAQGTGSHAHPHPANAAATQYLHFDTTVNGPHWDEDHLPLVLKNPVNVVIEQQSKQSKAQTSAKTRGPSSQRPYTKIQLSPVTMLASKLPQPKRQIHTETSSSHGIATDIQHFVEQPVKAQEPTPEPSEHSKYFAPEEIERVDLTDASFASLHTQKINAAFKLGQYKKINALYMAMKRNGIVPSRDVYAMVLSSIAYRDIDISVDDQLSTMLNVYSDLITNKIKPDLDIYSTVIYQLLDKSINAAVTPGISSNGGDFFKIAIDIFNASNCSHIQEFDCRITNLILTGMNLYPGLVNNTQLMKIMEQQPNFVKNEIYYSSMINYCKFTNDSELAISLYDQFKLACQQSSLLQQNQFTIYSTFISTLVSTNEISLATKFLDKLLTSIKNYEDYESKVTMLLSSYLLHLSKTNFNKTLEIWAQFNRIEWIPEFSYEFYSNLLQESIRCAPYETSLKLYNYMSALPRSSLSQSTENALDTLLITPRLAPQAVSQFLLSALQQQDKTTVLKMLRESFVRKTMFDYQVYAPLFHFIQSDELSVRIINTHGLTCPDPFEFLNLLSCNVANLPIYDISNTEFFKRLVSEFSLDQPKNFIGFLQVWKSVFECTSTPSQQLMDLCSQLIVEFHDLTHYYAQLPSQDVLDFKMALTTFFIQHCDPSSVGESQVMKDAVALLQDMKLMN